VRPEAYDDLPERAWEGIAVLRARSQADDGLIERLKAAVGQSVGEDVAQTAQELFEGVELGEAQSVIDRAVDTARSGDDAGAAALVREEFGSVCNEDHPERHVVDGDGRFSRCVRHQEGYDAPEGVIRRRLRRRRTE